MFLAASILLHSPVAVAATSQFSLNCNPSEWLWGVGTRTRIPRGLLAITLSTADTMELRRRQAPRFLCMMCPILGPLLSCLLGPGPKDGGRPTKRVFWENEQTVFLPDFSNLLL